MILSVSASTPMWSFRRTTRLAACFSTSHSPGPQSLRPVLSTSRWTGSLPGRGREHRAMSHSCRLIVRMVWCCEIKDQQPKKGGGQPSVWRSARRENRRQRQRRRDRQCRVARLAAARGGSRARPSTPAIAASVNQIAVTPRRTMRWRPRHSPCASAGALTVTWFTEAAIAAWKAEPRTTRGGQPRYSAWRSRRR